jgi:hypothetical protein
MCRNHQQTVYEWEEEGEGIINKVSMKGKRRGGLKSMR